MDMFLQYIAPVAMVICAVVCFIVKQAAQSEKLDRFIPLISAVLGLVIVAWANHAVSPEIVAQGLVSGLAATGCYELVKQFVQLAGEGK